MLKKVIVGLTLLLFITIVTIPLNKLSFEAQRRGIAYVLYVVLHYPD